MYDLKMCCFTVHRWFHNKCFYMLVPNVVGLGEFVVLVVVLCHTEVKIVKKQILLLCNNPRLRQTRVRHWHFIHYLFIDIK
jgi:hypothetical protein